MRAYLRNISVECIGPYEAVTYLRTGNTDHVDQKLVDRYADDMLHHRWYYPSGTIAISADGILRDGHHRLLAIIQSGIPQPMIVVRNVEKHYGSLTDE